MAVPLSLISKFLAIWDPHGQYSSAQWQVAQRQASIFGSEQTSEPEAALRRLGFAVEYKPLSVPGLLVWGRVVSNEKRVYLDREALTFLSKSAIALGVKKTVDDWPKRLVLAHELFHILASKRQIEHSELAAIVFACNCIWS
ncbi:TPA: hypothetical protein DD394_08925 [bacterium UBP9_UBA11836]|nr:hypothetical protein [bacterium UBP9_UBA11836]